MQFDEGEERNLEGLKRWEGKTEDEVSTWQKIHKQILVSESWGCETR